MKNLLTLLLILFAASFLASNIQRSWGDVSVQSLKIPTQNGQWVVADLFKPISATSKNKAPAVVIIPGFQRSKETLSNIAIELSRRGIVAISIDPYAQGGSSSSMSRRAATTEGYGMFALVDYIYNTDILNYIDKDRIAAAGHSAGGLAAIRGAQYFGKLSKETSTPNKLHSVFVSGMLRMGFKKKDIKKIRSNVGVSYALYDEGAWQNELGHGDLTKAPEVLRLINHQENSVDDLDVVEIGKYYGSLESNNMSVIFNEPVLHPFQPYSFEAISNQINFFLKVFGMSGTADDLGQIWYWKEILTLVSLVCSFMLIIPTARLLLALPYFKILVEPVPDSLSKPTGKGKNLFWISIILSTLIACISFIPLSELSKSLFVDASNRIQTWFFPQRMNNAVMLWAILNGIVGLLLFYFSYHFYGKNNGVKFENLGLEISKSDILKTICLALTIFFFYFTLINIIYYLFHVDYRFIFLGVRVFRPETLLLIPMYLPPFLIFFISNSIRVNSALRFKGQSVQKHLLKSSLVTSSGLMLILLVQYFTLWLTGTVFWEAGWLYVNLLFAIVPIMVLIPIFHHYFFTMTGRVYLGPITMSLIFITILLSNTVCYFPL